MALALTRKQGETIVLVAPDGVRITVEIAEVRGGQVRIAVDAPADVVVLRGELEET